MIPYGRRRSTFKGLVRTYKLDSSRFFFPPQPIKSRRSQPTSFDLDSSQLPAEARVQRCCFVGDPINYFDDCFFLLVYFVVCLNAERTCEGQTLVRILEQLYPTAVWSSYAHDTRTTAAAVCSSCGAVCIYIMHTLCTPRSSASVGFCSPQQGTLPLQCILHVILNMQDACGAKTSLEANNSSNICFVTILVYFLTMASTAGREIMNSEIAGSILTVFP